MNLHIGGTEKKDGWEILNIQPGPFVDHVGHIGDLTRFADNTFHGVYGSHVLEHITHREVVPTLQGIFRTLQPGGTLYISVPDLDTLFHFFNSPYASPQQKYATLTMIFGGQTDANDHHQTGFNEMFLRHFLTQAGFRGIQRVASFGIFKDTSEYCPFGFPVSLNMLGVKPPLPGDHGLNPPA